MTTRSKGKNLTPLNLEVGKGLRRGRYTKKEESTSTPSPPPQPKPSTPSIMAEMINYGTGAKKTLNSKYKIMTDRYEKDGWGTVAANDFQLQPSLINMVQQEQFAGFDHDDPNAHLISFLDVCATIKQNGVSSDTVRMRMFGFSLIGKAREWYKGLDREKVTTWKEMCRLFLAKYFPHSKAEEYKENINQFEQSEDEPLHEAWPRFKQLLSKCPDHGLEKDDQIIRFYRGLTIPTQKELDFASTRGFLNSDIEEALEIIERMVTASYEWSNSRRTGRKKNMSTNTDAYDDLMEKYAKLQKELEAKSKGKFHINAIDEESNAQLVEETNYLQGNFNKGYPRGNPAYHPNNRSHPNFSYSNLNNALQPPPGFNVQNGAILEPKKPTLEDIVSQLAINVSQFMAHSTSKMSTMEGTMIAMQKQLKMVEYQVGQISNNLAGVHKPGSFPSNTEQNPKGQQNCSAIELRSGTQYINHGPEPEEAEPDQMEEQGTQNEENMGGSDNTDPTEDRYRPGVSTDNPTDTPANLPLKLAPAASIPVPDPTPSISKDQAPFPQRLIKQKYEEKLQKFISLFSKVHINIPLLDALRDMPGYVKFLKDAVSSKRKLKKFETINMTEECSAVLQNKLPIKKKDPGSFSLTCNVGDHTFSKVLCDLGSSINLMPLSVAKRLKIDKEMKQTTISLLMANRSIVYPQGIVENVFVRVERFVFPVDFVILDMPEDKNQPLILGRPFLATGRALIDVQDGMLTFRLNDEELKISIYDAMKKADGEENECFAIQAMSKTDAILEKYKQPWPRLRWILQDPPPHEVDRGGSSRVNMKEAKSMVGESSRSDRHYTFQPP